MKKIKLIGPIILGTAFIVGMYFLYTYPYKITEKTPFSNIKFENQKVFVDINNTWYEWLYAENESIEEIQNFAKKKYADKWQHRISDDYILLMKDMGHWAFFSTSLQLKDPKGNSIEKSFPLSKENRALCKQNKRKQERIQRVHTSQIPDSLKYIAQRFDGYLPIENSKTIQNDLLDFNYILPMNSWVPKDLAIADLENFEYQLKNTYSYADLKGVDYPLLIDAIIEDLQDGITKRDLGIQIKRLLAFFGDGHTRVSRSMLKVDSLFLPFRIRKIEDKYIAVTKDKLYDSNYPEIVSIDGLTIESLKEKAGEMVAKGSSQFYESNSLSYLTYYGFLQQQLNIKNTAPKIQLANGKDTIVKEIKLLGKKELSKIYSRKESQQHRLYLFA